jgi:hypothetical protein
VRVKKISPDLRPLKKVVEVKVTGSPAPLNYLTKGAFKWL